MILASIDGKNRKWPWFDSSDTRWRLPKRYDKINSVNYIKGPEAPVR